ncbi:MAG: ClpXP protease specificity-enhancing factor [Azovibrio sp.]|uniref:ClpXP protease specificity-enhancing factor n=1 Tax=Azovibrio sp. TaxID=1872673 RepID=UPI003C757E77
MDFSQSPPDLPSTKPYLFQAIWDWCNDNGFTPYMAVQVDGSCRVPPEFVKDGQIVLNVGMEATQGLQINHECISFKARFAGVPRDIYVPVARVSAIYARENGTGMAFEVEETSLTPRASDEPEAPTPAGTGRSHLQRIK